MDKAADDILSVSGSDDDRFERLAFNEKLAELGRLSVGIIHELNTPLSVIVSAAQLVLREEELSEFTREMVERIGQEAERLSTMTRGVLTFSRRAAEPCNETDVNNAIHDVVELLRFEARKRSVEVVEELDHRIPTVSGDANRFRQIFINLMMNALQAMEGGGRLVVTTAKGGDGAIHVWVADTGPGIPADLAATIFEPFVTTKRPGEGTGLGLYVTRALVDSLGGQITLSSAPGRGTSFHLLFPTDPAFADADDAVTVIPANVAMAPP
jgi:two-component system NtrC family sensor kinase